jgi:hypothetical protein
MTSVAEDSVRRLILAALLACAAGGFALAAQAGEPPSPQPPQPAQPAPPTQPAQPAPAPQSDQEKIKQLQKEIDELRRRLEGRPEPQPQPTPAERVAELEAERDRLQGLLDQPLWRFHEDRFSPRRFGLDLGVDAGHTDNLGKTRHDRESDSYYRLGGELFWGSVDDHWGLDLDAGRYCYHRHDEEDYGDVKFTAVLGCLWYQLHDISDTSHFATDRIKTTRHTIAIGDDWSIRHPADHQGFDPLDTFISGEFVSGDLDYDAFTLMVGPRWNQMQRIRRGDYDEGLGWQFRALVGFTRRWYDTDDYRDETALVGQMDFAYAAPRWVGELRARSRLEDDLFMKTGHKRVSDVGFQVEQGSGWFRMVYGASAGEERFDEGDDQPGKKRHDFVARGRIGVDLRVLPHSVIGVAYVPEYHDSNYAEFDAVVNRIEAGLKLTF